MKIAVINETSAADKNADVLAALEDRNHDVINLGMNQTGASPEMTYIHTGLLTALLLNTKRVDFVVGGCGTGQGYLNAAMQFPNVFCGLIQTPMDAWLFTQINGGNCISLALNFGYGWAGNINLKFIFDRIFSVESGCGYPPHRKDSQKESRATLSAISTSSHFSMAEIINKLDYNSVIKPVLSFPGVIEALDISNIQDDKLRISLKKRKQANG